MHSLPAANSSVLVGRRVHARPQLKPLLAPVRATRSDNGRSARRRSSGSKGPADSDSSKSDAPATQLANNLAAGSQGAATPSPAAQIANNLRQQQPGDSPYPRATPAAAADTAADPAEVINQGVQSAANTADSVIDQSAAAAKSGIEAAANLTQQGISAAEAAAEDTLRNLAAAAEGTLNAAASAAGTVAGAVDGAAAAATSPPRNSSSSSNAAGNGGSASASGSFDSVSVRVPGNMGWANNGPSRGPIRDMTLTQDFDEDEVSGVKVEILAAVASLDRGLAANMYEARDVDRLAARLESAAGPVALKWSTSRSSPDASTMDKLAGTWRLIYSSGFNGGSLGGSRPGPPASLVPTVLGQIYQVIDCNVMTLDNVVELLVFAGLPQLPFMPKPEPQPTPGVRLTLRHSYEVAPPNSVTIVYEETTAKAIGPDLLQSLPQLGVPQLPDFLKPPKNFRSASFDVSYLDASMRITRGDRGELRIYLKDRPLTAAAPADYED